MENKISQFIKQLFNNKQMLPYFGISIFLVIVVLILILSLFLKQQQQQNSPEIFPTVTPIPTVYIPETYNKNQDGSFQFSPYQKTVINQTTDTELLKKTMILNKSTNKNGQTIYKIKSRAGNIEDEVRTKNGRVVFEKTTTLVNAIYGPLPNLKAYVAEFGQPETTQPIGSPEDFIEAYIYASKGFTLHLNSNTKTVYEVLRFIPMSVQEYKNEYPEYLVVKKGEGHDNPPH